MKKFLLLIINFYQSFLSAIIKNILGIDKMCKFSPTCSEYAKTAISKNGAIIGIQKSAIRILRCQSFFPSADGLIMGDFFNSVFIYPIINILVALYLVLSSVHFPYALGFAIIALTIVIRFIIYPLTTSQLKASLKMQKISPHLSRLKEKHKGDSARIQQETLKLYKEHGVNPAAGCLPIIIQMPIIWALYSVLQKIVTLKPELIVSEINKIVYFDFLKLQNPWETSFIGFPLGGNPSQLLSTIGPLVLIVPVATAIFQFLLSKMLIPAKSEVAIIEKKANIDKKDASDFASAFQTQSMYIFPVMIGFFSFSFPIGLSLYWNTFTIFGIIQQYKVLGLGGLSEWIKKK